MSSILKVSEIQDPTNGNTALEVDSSGNAKVNNPFIHIYMATGTYKTLTHNTTTKITDWTLDGASGITWDSTNDEIEIDVPGRYYVNFQAQVYSSVNQIRNIHLRVLKNGTQLFGAYSFVGVTPTDVDLRHLTQNVSRIINLAANDALTFEVFVQTGSGDALLHPGDTTGGEGSTNVSVFRVSD